MHRRRPGSVLLLALLLTAVARAQSEGPVDSPSDEPLTPKRDPLLDRAHDRMYDAVWRSSMMVDHWFGAQYPSSVYQKGVSGSIAPALLWDQFDGFQPRLRFNANFPLPQLNERFNAFIGRVDRDEFVTERSEPSGAFRRQFGPATNEETILGLGYSSPLKQGWRLDAGAGIQLGFPMDPYVKGSAIYQHGDVQKLLFTFRETPFWQASEEFGTTTRVDIERMFTGPWLVRWTSSGTLSQETSGIRGYSSIMGLRGFQGRRAFAVELGFNGESNAPVPLQDYGIKFAWRQSVLRKWLIMEVRTSVDWPKDDVTQDRHSSLGVGMGFEMLFGTEEFLARPVTF